MQTYSLKNIGGGIYLVPSNDSTELFIIWKLMDPDDRTYWIYGKYIGSADWAHESVSLADDIDALFEYGWDNMKWQGNCESYKTRKEAISAALTA